MPKLGEMQSGWSLGFKANTLHIWQSCSDCRKERWVQFFNGKPRHTKCRPCSQTGEGHPDFRRKANPFWKGGSYKGAGYVFVLNPEHSRSLSNGYVKRAILVLEEKLGRPIRNGYDSHHKNGIKDDDRPKNLEEKSHGDHAKTHNNHHPITGRFMSKEESLRVTTR